jgi:hypothetical protein
MRQILQVSEVVDYEYEDINRLTSTKLPNGVETGYA